MIHIFSARGRDGTDGPTEGSTREVLADLKNKLNFPFNDLAVHVKYIRTLGNSEQIKTNAVLRQGSMCLVALLIAKFAIDEILAIDEASSRLRALYAIMV